MWILGLFASLLPERWRPYGFVSWTNSLVSGIAQFLACGGLVLYRYMAFANARLMLVPSSVTIGAAEHHGETAVMGLGIIVLLEYLIHPLTITLFYFCFEGLVRTISAYVTGETLGTLPLIGLAWAIKKSVAYVHEKSLGQRVPDVVDKPGPNGYDLRIASCRPKLGWDHLITISYDDELYELVEQEAGTPPLRFVYLLRKKPQHKIVRGLHHYDPSEALAYK